MQGRLKSITLKSSQEAWQLDLPEILSPAAPAAHGQPQAVPHRVPISTAGITSRTAGQSAPARKYQKRTASASEPILENDDDDFMPPTKQHACACGSSSRTGTNLRRTLGESATSKLPSVRCAPSIFNKFTEHLTMSQRSIISKLGFGGLLHFSAEGLESSDLLVYLMDKLNPESMVLEVGNEGGLKINELCVRKVLGLPNGERDPPSSTEEENTRALVELRKSVHVERNKEIKCKHLLDLMRKLNLDNALAVRIFFIVAFNKLLFPALDNNIRGQDAYLTKDLSQFCNINWCKAVVHELCHAAITWRSEKKKSIPGCGIFLIIFYLDNLECRSSIDHFAVPRAKFFHKSVMENIILEDKRRDKPGKETFGNLQLRNIANTCYQYTEPAHNGASAAADSSSSLMFPGAEELGVLFTEIDSSPSRNMASNGMKLFGAKASQAINFIQSGSQILVDAHKEFIQTMRNVLEKEAVEKRRRDQDPRYQGPGEENHSRSNEDSSFFQCGAAHAKETVPRCQTGPGPHAVPTTHAPIEREEYEMHVQGEAYSDGNLHNAMSNDDLQMATTDRIIPAAEGCSEPKTPTHIHNIHAIQESRSNPVEKHFESDFTVGEAPTSNNLETVPRNEEQYGTGPASNGSGILDEPQRASTIIATSDTSKDGLLGGISMFASTQADSGYRIHARPRIHRLVNIPTRYRSPFKCIAPRPAIDMIIAQAVRNKICTELKASRQFVIWGPSQCLNCRDVAESFADGASLYKSFMTYFVDCMRVEEEKCRPKCVGFRVFLSGYLGEMLNHDDECQRTKYPDLAAFIKLTADIGDLDLYQVKLFLVPICENNHYTVYCLNMVDERIEILDSSNENHDAYHSVVGDRVVPRLNDLFQKVTNGKFKDFSNWKRPIRTVIQETGPNDSAFIAMKTIELWDGDRLHLKENVINMSEIRAEMLFYMLYNSVNQVKNLPYGLEAYRPLQ